MVICFARKQPVQRVRGRQDGEDEIKKRNKEMFEVRQLVSEWNYTISHSTVLNHTDKDRKNITLTNLNQRIFRHHEVKYERKLSNMQVERQQFVKLSI